MVLRDHQEVLEHLDHQVVQEPQVLVVHQVHLAVQELVAQDLIL